MPGMPDPNGAAAVTHILAIRHGETDWNTEQRLQGHTDIPLNAKGREQARRLAEALREQELHAVYSSDLSRAKDTAVAFAVQRQLPLQLTPALRERGFGSFEGLTYAEVDERWPQEAARWRRRDLSFAPPGGESLPQFHDRCVSALLGLAMAHSGQTIAVVAHGGVLDAWYRAASRAGLQAPRTWEMRNATINRLMVADEGLMLIGWNDGQHLDDL
jgi:2,3-bisphosphoglycerate-dependent phosphoglycerate mutase